MEQFHTVIIGGGPGGMRAARLLAEAKKSVALVNTELGGECLNWGCIPAKAFLHAAEIIDYVAHAGEHGVKVDAAGGGIDFAKLMERQKNVVLTLQKQAEQFLKMIGVTLISGRGKMKDAHTVEIVAERSEAANAQGENRGTQTLQAENIIIATGSDARLLPGLERSEKIIISNDIFRLTELPKKLFIIGGGAIGVEFASAFRAFGSEVEIVEAAEHLLPLEDKDLGQTLEKSFAECGIIVKTGTKIADAAGVDADKVLIAVGRSPSIDAPELDALGIAHTPKGIETNEFMQTKVPHIYAIGDVAGKALLAYTAEREGEIAIEHILGMNPEPLDYGVVPSTIFCHPEVASVGVRTGTVAKGFYLANGKAAILGKTTGFAKIIADEATKKIVGAHIIGEKATELIHAATIMVTNGLTVHEALKTVTAHPVLGEVLQDALHRLKKML